MKLSLKKFTHNERLSEETQCFAAVVCIDGKPAFEATNHGQGGCNDYHPINGIDRTTMYACLKQIEEYAATLPAEVFHGMELKKDTDWIIADLVEAAIQEKHKNKFIRSLNAKIHMIDGGQLYSLKVQSVNPTTIELAKKKYPTANILNAISADEAWDAAKTFLGFAG